MEYDVWRVKSTNTDDKVTRTKSNKKANPSPKVLYVLLIISLENYHNYLPWKWSNWYYSSCTPSGWVLQLCNGS